MKITLIVLIGVVMAESKYFPREHESSGEVEDDFRGDDFGESAFPESDEETLEVFTVREIRF